MLKIHQKAILEEINDDLLQEKGVKLYVKREDLLHSEVSGNKWRKLKYNLAAAVQAGQKTILTFGGAYSNHIYATAAAAKEMGLNSIGVIRGEATTPLNPTLSFAVSCGMHLHYISRSLYREKHQSYYISSLHELFGDFYYVPEGGSNSLALKGCAEIVDEISIPYDYLCTAVGTGGTMAGLIASEPTAMVVGFPALKGDFLTGEVLRLLNDFGYSGSTSWLINNEYHCGGYAKVTPELIAFIVNFRQKHALQLDPIYTGKMMFGIFDLLSKNYFKKGSTIVALHTGGLQGNVGMEERLGIQL